ncbi:MAG: 2-keto-4-pentenoate hydratase, partial [Frankiales bacterium]|nr:2-keto-4-pentenoate hydratase [Frankiales bacterium]
MGLTDAQRHQAAEALRTAEATQVAIAPLLKTYPSIDVVDAYEIQLSNIRRRLAAGATVHGHKVGLSSKAMQEMMGVDEPDYGHLLSDMVYTEESPIPAHSFLIPRV